MRHRQRNRKLGRTSSHRSALFRNQLASIIREERIVTTLPKAKELRPIIEKMVTLGRDDSVHHRRQAARSIADKDLLRKLFEEIAPRFSDRPGGYTRIVKLGPRRGDGAEMAILEFIDFELTPGADKPAPKKKTASAKSSDDDAGDEPDTEEESTKKKAPAKKSAKKKATGSKKSKSTGSKKSSTKKDAGKKSAPKKSAPKKSGSKKTTRKSSRRKT
ncbi:MAG: 50S ribosomal protein L17 [Acidobacteria bacterium]|nr:50S ribosomal protein L17 [Acidobacteriota bacterium]